jgi:hypothetical protein
MVELPAEGEPTRSTFHQTLRYVPLNDASRIRAVFSARTDQSVAMQMLEVADAALARHGYQIQRSLGKVKGHAIFVAAPIPVLVASGQFPDSNTYPKVVTAIDVSGIRDAEHHVDLWLGGYLPILRTVRHGLMTSLFRVVYDEPCQHLLLFTEYVADARFGTDLEGHNLALEEAFGLGYIVCRQVLRLHRRGLAHNNVGPDTLMFKGIQSMLQVRPAMVGLVDPSFDRGRMADDVRNVAGLVHSWLRPTRIEILPEGQRQRIRDVRQRLKSIATDPEVMPPLSDSLTDLMAYALGTIDENFDILRSHGGNLETYSLRLIEHALYARLWTTPALSTVM